MRLVWKPTVHSIFEKLSSQESSPHFLPHSRALRICLPEIGPSPANFFAGSYRYSFSTYVR
ncbi:hypothetical protein HPB50_021013 [Hyalomma asiaticum]|uniref:Uncharacterized protein n=1 Tax=Hyalomma asiaticum TaxID=266040 RepID=A0ACB7SS00_HYAAI|nr:hypothetical protein HPB50_021013 [Hyalomma asiaticum]